MEQLKVDAASGFIPGILNDSLWVVNQIEVNESDLQLGDTISLINGKRPADVFGSTCDYFMNIRSFLKSDSLILELANNRTLKIKQ